jgi:hypothetical protein
MQKKTYRIRRHSLVDIYEGQVLLETRCLTEDMYFESENEATTSHPNIKRCADISNPETQDTE